MQVLITGGAGFLGSHLCEALLAKDDRVICIDNLDTGSLQNIEHIANGGPLDDAVLGKHCARFRMDKDCFRYGWPVNHSS